MSNVDCVNISGVTLVAGVLSVVGNRLLRGGACCGVAPAAGWRRLRGERIQTEAHSLVEPYLFRVS